MMVKTMQLSYPRKISKSVYVVGNHLFQSYLIRGESCALIEAGVTWSVPQMLMQLKELGIAPEEIDYLIVSHAHFDHVCGIPGLKKACPNLKIMASETAARILGKEKIINGFFNEDFAFAENLRNSGRFNNIVQQSADSNAINVDMIINEGMQLDLGNGALLHFRLLPGHSPCSVAAFLPSEQVLFPSDCGGYPISEDIIFPLYFAGYKDYLISLQKLQNIEASILAAPHELLLLEKWAVNTFFEKSVATTTRFYEFILGDYKKGKSQEDICQELFDKYYIGGIANYSRENIMTCTDLLVRRTIEEAESNRLIKIMGDIK